MQNIIILIINSFTFFQDHPEHGCPPLQLHRAEEFFLGMQETKTALMLQRFQMQMKRTDFIVLLSLA